MIFRVFVCTAIAVASTLGASAAPAEPLRLITYFPGPLKNNGNGQMSNITDEIIRQVFAVLRQDVSFEYFPTPRAWVMIVRGERDGITAVLRTPEREKTCLFPDEPMYRDRSVLFARSADTEKLKFSSFDDLAGHSVAANKSFLPDAFEYPSLSLELLKFLRAHNNMVETSVDAEALQMLAAGRVDYAAMNLALGQHEIQTLKLSRKVEPLLSRSVIEQEVSVCFARARVSPALVDAFSRALKQFEQTEAYQAIRREYIR